MAGTALRLLVGVAAISALTGTATAQALMLSSQSREILVPDNRPDAPLFRGTTAVASGFSGNVLEKPVLEKGVRRLPDVAYRFKDPDGVSVTLAGISDMGFAPNGHEITTLPYDSLKARVSLSATFSKHITILRPRMLPTLGRS